MAADAADPVAVHVEMGEVKSNEEEPASAAPAAPVGDDYDTRPTRVPVEHYGYGSGKLGLYEFTAGPFTMNPIVSIVAAMVLWGFTIWCMEDEESSVTLGEWKGWVTECFSWFYIGTQNVWIVFMLVIMYYHGSKKLGKDDERPEFGNLTYFAMLFSAGVAVGLFVYGTAEPLYHYDYWLKHRYNANGELDNDKANYAILLSLYHWGLHGWVPYALVGVQMGIMSYRYGLPLLMRTAFYPLLGRHTWGWIGDSIDAFTIITVVSGVCTSLGLGVVQLAAGFDGLGWLPDPCDGECKRDFYLIVIWGITCVATVSVVSGLGYGIKTISQLAAVSAFALWLLAFLLGDTWFYINNMTQSVGYYAQFAMTQLGWHVDAFAQQPWGSGGSPDQMGPAKAVEGGSTFMNSWTIFYWGWWIAWCPFVGTFIARISRGRTVREVIVYSLGGPLITSLLWFGLFGGMGIAMENNAQLLWQAGTDLYNDPTVFQTGMHGNAQADFAATYVRGPIDSRDTTGGGFGTSGGRCNAWVIPLTTNSSCVLDEVTSTYLNGGQPCRPFCNDRFAANAVDCIPQGAVESAPKACGACFVQQASFDRAGVAACDIFAANPKNADKACPKYIQFWQANVEMSPVCLFSDSEQNASWYNTMGQFGPKLGPFLNVLSICLLILFFVTSSDSGSLVVDTIAANGRDEASVLQRVFWAFTEGGLATGLVLGAKVGEEDTALGALQAASICTGLPYTCMLCFMMPAIWQGFTLEDREKNPITVFKTPIFGGIFDIVDCVLSRGKCPFPAAQTKNFFLFGALPFVGAHQLAIGSKKQLCGSNAVYASVIASVVAVSYISWIVLMSVADDGLWGMAWVMYFVMVAVLANLRRDVRMAKGIFGNFVEDIASAIFMYPNALVQTVEALDMEDDKPKEN